MTNLRIKITFNNCVFNIANTTNLLTIDYSDGSGCTTDDRQGDISIINSIF